MVSTVNTSMLPRMRNALQCLSNLPSRSKTGEQAEATCGAAVALFKFIANLTKACPTKSKKDGKQLERFASVEAAFFKNQKVPHCRPGMASRLCNVMNLMKMLLVCC